jgi:hypothetical protein
VSETHKPLLQGISQFEVDFVIPRIGIDLQLGIDPFLLYKSRDPNLAGLHETILRTFGEGIQALTRGSDEDARYLLNFPEVGQIGLGYAKKGKRGSGVGPFRQELVIETLKALPALNERGIRHIEELQLLSAGIGPDRISDIAANLIKSFLIEYTQRQCALWSIPLVPGVPVEHVFNPKDLSWEDGHFDLPVSPIDQSAILLVPRRIVRALPWINYDDYFRQEFAAFHRAKRARQRLQQAKAPISTAATSSASKDEIVRISRAEIERIDRYIARKEQAASDAQPSQAYLDAEGICPEAESLAAQLHGIPTGAAAASRHQAAVLAVLNYLFNPELIDGELEVRTVDGTERRDIIFTNDSDRSFWTYIRQEHSAIFLMFEIKNTGDLENNAYNQTATYLGDRLGRLAFIVTREEPGEAQLRKAYSIYNDPTPRRIILTLSDNDLRTMLDMKCRGQDPMRFVQTKYRTFRTSVQ